MKSAIGTSNRSISRHNEARVENSLKEVKSMRICGKVTYRYDDVTQREWGRSGGEYTLRNSHIFWRDQERTREKQRLHCGEWPGATAVNGKDEVVGFWQWTWVEEISELWGQDAVLDLRRELELSLLNA